MKGNAVKYAPGMRIIVRDEEWVVKKVETNSFGNQTLYVTGISGLVHDYEAVFVSDLEKRIEIVDPVKIKLVPDDSKFYRKSKVYLESQWRQKFPTDHKIHIGYRAAMDLLPYQLEPAQRALNKPRQRILIADTVGLGKTLEAGILMSELIVRGKGRRILVVTVKSMMTQFQKEMWNRFTIPLMRLDAGKIQRIRAKIPSNSNPFYYYDKSVISVDTLKNDLDYRTFLEKSWWDIIVIDEAHNVARRGDKNSQRGRLAGLLANKSDTLIMLSATPHDGKAESFASIMNMLDPAAIADPDHYGPEDVKDLCIRRFKKDIQSQASGSFKERVITIEECKATEQEEYAYGIFAGMELQMDLAEEKKAGQLFRTSLEKSLFSSPAACIKSIDARLKKLYKRYDKSEIEDMARLEELKGALEKITPDKFSRYIKLVELLKSREYAWSPEATDDRLVIFTERIETMRFLAENLRKDLGLSDQQVQTMYGGMSDEEQQKVVDEFGRAESPIRILMASDVAAEGINLHYLSHRLIHFDIPWSLMVFQQRNGRIDRYGQQERPDIRYMLLRSDNARIKGDARIMEILVKKEEQAFKNIGDPAVLLGKFHVEEEEKEVAKAIENGMDADVFAKMLDTTEEKFAPFELLMSGNDTEDIRVEYSEEETIFSDMDYIRNAVSLFADTEECRLTEMDTAERIKLRLSEDLKRKLSKIMPEEAMPKDGELKLSTDKGFCMKEMKRCMQNDVAEAAWPAVQYLWALHPVFNWLNDKAGMLYRRGEAPLVGIQGKLSETEYVYIVEGQVPNRKSAPVIDEWFGLHFRDGIFAGALTMEEVAGKAQFRKNNIPNQNPVSKRQIAMGEQLLVRAVDEALKIIAGKCEEYEARTEPYVEIEKDHPYIRIVGAVTGVK